MVRTMLSSLNLVRSGVRARRVGALVALLPAGSFGASAPVFCQAQVAARERGDWVALLDRASRPWIVKAGAK